MSVSRSVSLLLILLLFDTIVPDRSAISGDGPDSMVLVPAGEFMMGTPEGSDGLPDEHPTRLVYLGAFWIDRYGITVTVAGALTSCSSVREAVTTT